MQFARGMAYLKLERDSRGICLSFIRINELDALLTSNELDVQLEMLDVELEALDVSSASFFFHRSSASTSP